MLTNTDDVNQVAVVKEAHRIDSGEVYGRRQRSTNMDVSLSPASTRDGAALHTAPRFVRQTIAVDCIIRCHAAYAQEGRANLSGQAAAQGDDADGSSSREA